MPDNTLYYGDNLEVLRDYIATESVDLIYLDPPFNSNASYNVLFGEQNGSKAAARQAISSAPMRPASASGASSAWESVRTLSREGSQTRRKSLPSRVSDSSSRHGSRWAALHTQSLSGNELLPSVGIAAGAEYHPKSAPHPGPTRFLLPR